MNWTKDIQSIPEGSIGLEIQPAREVTPYLVQTGEPYGHRSVRITYITKDTGKKDKGVFLENGTFRPLYIPAPQTPHVTLKVRRKAQ